jgi:hypothetical protein
MGKMGLFKNRLEEKGLRRYLKTKYKIWMIYIFI